MVAGGLFCVVFIIQYLWVKNSQAHGQAPRPTSAAGLVVWPTASCTLFTSMHGEGLSFGVVEAVIGGKRGEHVHAKEENDEVDAHRDQPHPDGCGEPAHAVLRKEESRCWYVEWLNLYTDKCSQSHQCSDSTDLP